MGEGHLGSFWLRCRGISVWGRLALTWIGTPDVMTRGGCHVRSSPSPQYCCQLMVLSTPVVGREGSFYWVLQAPSRSQYVYCPHSKGTSCHVARYVLITARRPHHRRAFSWRGFERRRIARPRDISHHQIGMHMTGQARSPTLGLPHFGSENSMAHLACRQPSACDQIRRALPSPPSPLITLSLTAVTHASIPCDACSSIPPIR